MPTSEENNDLREEFYDTIESLIEKISKRDIVILLGDFNAKTGTGHTDFPKNMGTFGEGIFNSSGRRLLETCKSLDLVITNTLFNHKKSHRTTWTAPFRNFITRDGEESSC